MDYNSITIKQLIKILIKKYRFTDADNINPSFSVSVKIFMTNIWGGGTVKRRLALTESIFPNYNDINYAAQVTTRQKYVTMSSRFHKRLANRRKDKQKRFNSIRSKVITIQ